MATTTAVNVEEHSKRERILNALAVYPEEVRVSNQVIADLTGASTSWVYQIRSAIETEELHDELIESLLDPALQSEYRQRIDDVLEEYDVSSRDEQTTRLPVEKSVERNDFRGDGGAVSIEKIQRIRDIMSQYRDDAEFERQRFQGNEKNVAEEKYFIANRATELLEQLIAEQQSG